MELEDKQFILNSVALLVREYIPKLGWEVLPNGNEDQLMYLSKEDIEQTSKEIFHLNHNFIIGINKALCEGEWLVISSDGVKLAKPDPTRIGFSLNLESLGIDPKSLGY